MNTNKKRGKGQILLSLFLAINMFLISAIGVNAKELTSAENLRDIQKNIIEWKTGGDSSYFLSDEFLAGAGESGSDWYALDIARIWPKESQAEYLDALEQAVTEKYQNLEETKNTSLPTDWYRLILTVGACGGNPQNFGTDAKGNVIDLVNDGIWNCIFDDPGMQGINGYIWALIAIDSGDYQEPKDAKWTREKLLNTLLSKQKEDGGFSFTEGGDADSDMTSMALTAMAAYKDDVTVAKVAEKAFSALSKMQAEDGSMTSGSSSAESTSWAVMALSAWGIDAQEESAFIKNDKSLLDGLLLFHTEEGGILHTLDPNSNETGGNSMASYQALYAIEAYCRLLEGREGVFDYSDMISVSEREGENSDKDAPDILTIVAITAGVIVVVVILLAVLMNRDRKQKKKSETVYVDDEEDDW